MTNKPQSFTVRHSAIARVLESPVVLFPPDQPTNQNEPGTQMKAIWDTGATNTCITRSVIDKCGLAPIGYTEVHHAAGTMRAEKYLVTLGLPNRVLFRQVEVTVAEVVTADVLVGMDIIGRGDFSVTADNGCTVMSFRYPHGLYVDYVEEYKQKKEAISSKPTKSRNALCECGSGKKYKSCCMRKEHS